MKDRWLLLLLLVTAVFILFVKPARESIELMQTRLTVVESQIAAQKALKAGRSEIERRISSAGTVAEANERYLYPITTSSSMALVDLQDTVRTAATQTRMEIVTSTWGEPVTDPVSGLTRIPMSFVLKGGPAEIDPFLRKLQNGSRFVKVERASVTKFQDQYLTLNLALVAFKRGNAP
ncbi:general secretion pathway protein M [Geobacter sp. OR-1]|uniref:GspMb/PilO family protein n=1 Tax=Geobacter sp. OR-1 TaxID=1266765 RepID=UPI000541FCC9|nr:GspMb/PilO family protein [Geobacter sp. OR-1]GAM08224.1 general secretion pathway protein M [Geobacter sp. OR-1]